MSEVIGIPFFIKARIAQSYSNSQIIYALLVGDPDDLPMYTYTDNGENIPSDYWYGLVAGNDLLLEVSIGRITGKKFKVYKKVFDFIFEWLL